MTRMPFTTPDTNDSIKAPDGYIIVSRQELELEHRQLLARVKRLRQRLGYAPLLTAKEKRRQQQQEE